MIFLCVDIINIILLITFDIITYLDYLQELEVQYLLIALSSYPPKSYLLLLLD